MRHNSLGHFISKTTPVGIVDLHTIAIAHKLGIIIESGTINKKHKHVMLNSVKQFPGCHSRGSALRSRVVWWLNTGEVIKGGEFDIHHINKNKIDDSFSNLEKLSHKEHTHHHNPKGLSLVSRFCISCGGEFKIVRWRLRDPSRGKYCSQNCYHSSKVSSVKRSIVQ